MISTGVEDTGNTAILDTVQMWAFRWMMLPSMPTKLWGVVLSCAECHPTNATLA